MLRVDDHKVVRSDGRVDKTVMDLSKFKKLKKKKSKNLTYIRALEKPIFLISGAKKALNCLWQAFIKAPIF